MKLLGQRVKEKAKNYVNRRVKQRADNSKRSFLNAFQQLNHQTSFSQL